MENNIFMNIAHRGASAYYPENTLLSFQSAIEMGINFLECDLRLTKDKEIVVIHDRKVDRTTDGVGYVSGFSLKEIKKLDAGSYFDSKYSFEKIPTLSEVLSILKNNKLVVEIKDGVFYPEIIDKVISLIKKNDLIYNINISAFHWEVIEKINQIEPAVKTSALVLCSSSPEQDSKIIDGKKVKVYSKVEELINDAKAYKVDIICPPADFLNEMNVKKMHKEGFLVRAWGLNTEKDEAEMKRLISCNIDGMTTNYPDVLKKVYKKAMT